MTASDRPLVVLTAGGSGGHVFPAEALAAELTSRGCRVALITDRRGGKFSGFLEDVETHRIHAGAIAGKALLRLVKSVPELAMGLWQARALLRRLRPQAVIGFGGYASVPAMLAAVYGGFRTAIHEQNAVLGRANRLLASKVGCIGISFQNMKSISAAADAKTHYTGMPVRPAVTEKRGRPYPYFTGRAPINLLVMGGSQGARVFSDVVPAALSRLPRDMRDRVRVSQQCRAEDLDRTRITYRQSGIDADLASFFTDVPERMGEAHLIITRSGAGTVAELSVIGRPAVLVPYPHAVDDHQSANGRAVETAGAGWLMPQESFTPEALAARLTALFKLPVILEKAAAAARVSARPDAAERLADMVLELMDGNGHAEPRKEAA